MKTYVIPAGSKFDEGKGGPWIKLTWAEAAVVKFALNCMYTIDEGRDACRKSVLVQLAEQSQPIKEVSS